MKLKITGAMMLAWLLALIACSGQTGPGSEAGASSESANITANITANSVDVDAAAGRIDDLIGRGEKLYQRMCTACHSLDHNRVGPSHRGVYGRAAGAVPDYRYSRALQELDVVWSDDSLDAWLENPIKFAPGTKMGSRVSKAQDRRALIQYLKSISAPEGDQQ